jgi:hypothetical protein
MGKLKVIANTRKAQAPEEKACTFSHPHKVVTALGNINRGRLRTPQVEGQLKPSHRVTTLTDPT